MTTLSSSDRDGPADRKASHVPGPARGRVERAVSVTRRRLSTLSLPLVAGHEGIGALNLNAKSENGFSPDDEVLGTELAAAAAIVLANAHAYRTAMDLGNHLGEAMKSRAVIEQAKGMMMAHSPLDADGAFDVLRRSSQRENAKLRDIAQRQVDRQLPPTSPTNEASP